MGRTDRPTRGRLMMTAFGWNDSGGGTTVPRLAAKELARRGWDVTVFHAAVTPIPGGRPYELRAWEDDGVRLIGVHNRPHGLADLGHPHRELDDPQISAAFAEALDSFRPSVVHFHNLHNLGASLFDQAFARGLPAYFSTHNYWLICPRLYLMDGHGAMCPGPGDGGACASCVASHDVSGHQRRLAEIRARAQRGLTAVLAVSDSVRRTLLAAGYPAHLVDVVRQAMPHEAQIWEEVGRTRKPGRVGERLTVAFLGSAYPHKGPQLLVQAAQRTQAEIRVRILGEVPARFAKALTELDHRGVVELSGAFEPAEIGALLRGVDAVALPSQWWDCAPLAAAECLAARTPLIVPRLGGLPEVITEDVDGLSFPGLDADALAGQLDRIALEPGLLERLQAAIVPPRTFGEYIDELESYYGGDRPGSVGPDSEAPLAVRWQGDHGQATSLSIVNDNVTSRLGGPIQRVARDGTSHDPPLPHAADVEVRHQWPPDLRRSPAGKLAVIQPWEFGAIPRAWIGEMQRNVDEIWVPSQYVRQMYIASGIDPDAVVSIPNGVDLEIFRPADARASDESGPVRFLFVGGLIWRKAPDVLMNAWRAAFRGREDVVLILKDFGSGGIYRNAERGPIRDYAASGELPRVELLEDELSGSEMIVLYQSCDVLVHPYRGEGFAMPVLEAMACGIPVITTGGGPTDEFCPPEAGWRIDATRKVFAEDRVDTLQTVGTPWVLEPDTAHLAALLQQAAADDVERRRRGAAARRAAQQLSWDAVAELYARRLEALSRMPARPSGDSKAAFPLAEDVTLRVLATPAWRGSDRLGDLLLAWSRGTSRATSACLYLLADPHIDGDPSELEQHVLAAAAATGADIESCADINVLMEPLQADRDLRLHAAVDAYVPLHRGCSGHERIAIEVGNAVIEPDHEAFASLLECPPQARVA